MGGKRFCRIHHIGKLMYINADEKTWIKLCAERYIADDEVTYLEMLILLITGSIKRWCAILGSQHC